MSDRSTKIVETSGGKKVEFYDYLTGREESEIQKIYISGAKYKLHGIKPEDVEIEGFEPAAALDAQMKMVELLVVSVDGSRDNPSKQVFDLPAPEYKEVLDALDEATGKKGA